MQQINLDKPTKGVGFGTIKIPMKAFLVELQYRDDENDEEYIKGFELLEIPDLKNANLNTNFLVTCLWCLLENDYKSRKINQVFIYNKRGENILFRLSEDKFTDEESAHYTPPSESKHNQYLKLIKNRIRKLYDAHMEPSYQRYKIPVSTIQEYYKYYQEFLV